MFFLSKVTINVVKLFQSFFLDLFSIETINFEFEHSREWFTYWGLTIGLLHSFFLLSYGRIYNKKNRKKGYDLNHDIGSMMAFTTRSRHP